MMRMCAWCRAVLGFTDDLQCPITHGICADCAEQWSDDEPAARVDALAGPVVGLDGEGRVVAANQAAVAVLGGAARRGVMIGDVVGCRHATLPGGCGKTDFCDDCVLRNTFEQTAATGVAAREACATIAREDGSTQLTVTTERTGASVLVRIDARAPES